MEHTHIVPHCARKYVRFCGPLRASRGGFLGSPPPEYTPTQRKATKPSKPPRNRDETPEGNHGTEYFFNMEKNMFSFVKKMFGFVVFFGGFVAVSWRFRGGFDGFVALRGKTQAGGREAGAGTPEARENFGVRVGRR